MERGSAKLADVDLTGQTIADFQIIRRLGQGGMGQVFLAEQTSLKRKVALKFLRPDVADNPASLSRFKAEAKAVAKLSHANIVQVYTVGEHGGMPYMALEYVEGMNLRDYLTKKGAPDVPRAILIMRQVAAALQRAGEAGLVHRDIKPENILLTRKGEVKVADFGLSRVCGDEPAINLTQSGMTMGTPLYMSPEQVQGKSTDPRSDIYSFGVTCYHLLAGQPPFSGKTAIEVALKHLNETAKPLAELRPDLPADLIRLVERMMAKDPARRPQSGREVLRELGGNRSEQPNGIATTLPIDAAPPTLSGGTMPVPMSARRVPWTLIGATALALLLGGVMRLTIAPRRLVSAATPIPGPDQSEDERFLLSMVKSYSSKPTPNQNELRQAFKIYVQLAVLYLDQRRFAEAGEFANQLPDKESSMAFLKKLLTGIIYADTDEPDKAVKMLKLAFADRPSANQFLSWLNMPPSREGVDLRGHIVKALERLEKWQPLPPDLARLHADSLSVLERPTMPPATKKGRP